MIPDIAFMLANYAFRPLGYQAGQWDTAEQATRDYFAAPGTFSGRFEAYLADVRALGFRAVDLWQPMLDPRWASDEHIDTAADLLDDYELQVVSYAGWLGESADEFERNCEIAAAIGAPLLTGSTRADQEFVNAALRKFGLKWAYENEPEPTPEAVLQVIGGYDADVVGVCADTGWFGTHGFDAVDALRTLAPRLFHVHLKDVRRAGDHVSCRYGAGIVPVERCVQTLRETGYAGAISIENETSGGDPTEDCAVSLNLLRRWLA